MYETKEDNSTEKDNTTEEDNTTKEDNSTGEDLNPHFYPTPVPIFSFSSPPDIWQWTALQNLAGSALGSSPVWPAFGSAFGFQQPQTGRFFEAENTASSSGLFGSSNSTFGGAIKPDGSNEEESLEPQPNVIMNVNVPEVPEVETQQEIIPENMNKIKDNIGLKPLEKKKAEGESNSSSKVVIYPQMHNPAPSVCINCDLKFPHTTYYHEKNEVVNGPEVAVVEEVRQNPAIEGKEVVNGPEVAVVDEIRQNPAIEGNEVVNGPQVAVVEEVRQNPAIEGNEVVNGPQVAVVEEIRQNPAIEVVNDPDCGFCQRPILPNEERLQCSEGMRGANHLKVIQPPCGSYLHVTCVNQHLRTFPDPANRKQRLLPKCPNCIGDITKRCPFCRKKLKRPVYQCRRDINGRRCPAQYCNIACFFRSRHRRTAH